MNDFLINRGVGESPLRIRSCSNTPVEIINQQSVLPLDESPYTLLPNRSYAVRFICGRYELVEQGV